MFFAYMLVVLVKVENFYGKKLVKSVIGVILKQSELSLLTITDDRIFIEKLATFFDKSKCGKQGCSCMLKNITEHVRLCRIAFRFCKYLL